MKSNFKNETRLSSNHFLGKANESIRALNVDDVFLFLRFGVKGYRHARVGCWGFCYVPRESNSFQVLLDCSSPVPLECLPRNLFAWLTQRVPNPSPFESLVDTLKNKLFLLLEGSGTFQPHNVSMSCALFKKSQLTISEHNSESFNSNLQVCGWNQKIKYLYQFYNFLRK